MKKISAYIISTFLSFFVLFSISHAAVFDGIVTCGRGTSAPCDYNDVINLFNNIIKYIAVAAGIIATITFTVAGWNILTHPDNPGERQKAKDMFRKTIIGIFFLLCGFLIVKLIVGALVKPELTTTGDNSIFRWLNF